MDEFDCPINLNPEAICRICLEIRTPLNDLFVKEIVDGELLALPMIFQQLFRIKVLRGDKLPQRVCTECKQKLIELTKFKRKCENSNKTLHELLQPGYDYVLRDVNPKLEPHTIVKQDFSCQTDEPEPLEVIHKVDETIAKEFFEDGLQYHKIITKLDQLYTGEKEFDEICNLYTRFESGDEIFCTLSGCDTRITTMFGLQSHMKEQHSDKLNEILEKLDVLDTQEPVSEMNLDDPVSEQYTITENDELIQVAEYEEDQYLQENVPKTVTNDVEHDKEELLETSFCPICHKLYQGTEEIEKHQILHAIVLPTLFDNIEHYCCDTCKSVFVSIEHVKEHFNYCHEDFKPDPNNRGINQEFESLPPIQTKLLMFKQQPHDEATSENEQSFLEMFEMDCTYVEFPFICGVCHKSYTSVESIRYHTFGHLSSFSCPLSDCKAVFDFSYKLLAHMKFTHFKEKMIDFVCPLCKEEFTSKKACGIHFRESCSKRNLPCVLCTKRFVNQAALKSHQKVHDQHKCEECDEMYATSSDLRHHLRKFHADDNKMYKCGQCDKRFRTPSHRSDHEESHSTENKYQCNVCMNFYKSERVLKSHMKLHTVGRSHACPVCGKMFNRNYHVKLHLKTHKEKIN